MIFTERCIQTKSGLTLFTESMGNPQDPAVILIMGAMNQGIFWYGSFCERLAQAGLFVVRFDHRDTGYSSVIDFRREPYDLDDLTDDVLDILDAYRIKKAHVVGLSMGGYIGQLLAVNFPDRVDTLTLISTTADHRPYMDATMGNFANKYTLPYPAKAFLDYIGKGITNPPKDNIEASQYQLEGWRILLGKPNEADLMELTRLVDLSNQRSKDRFSAFNHGPAVLNSRERIDIVKHIKARTLIFHGEHDPCLPIEHGRSLHELIPNSELEIVSGMGHMFTLIESNYLAVKILEWLGK